ncbi:DUF2955 domain-containing protein [Bosea sp. PAMC 26642]|uniref:DUF2955 domain-containing protein n=1 Tax=Bosea sp. (strain PAMC 26642) TaxID=1792307 RepID=UPI0007705585|nr:DUF2955 domain-containing protein [Bosea sp. PAMC 26642]AMJ62009.1 hypothetical protein AXW83_18400 [Bosea sp. PAMC 26642]
MPADTVSRTAVVARQRRVGLRVALAVAVGMTVGVGSGAVIPFLGPLFAAQFLLGGARPLPVAKAIGTVGLILLLGQFFIVMTGVFGSRPVQLLILLGMFFFLCFFLQASGKGGPAVFVSLVISVMVPLLDLLHGDLDQSMIMILFQGSAGGVALSWLAHAVLPEPAGEPDRPAQQPAPVADPIARALANTLILLGAVTLCLTNSAFSSAIVIPITVASLLLQLDLAASARASVGLVAVNLLGGVLASLAFTFVDIRPSLLLLFLTTFLIGLLLGGRAATPLPIGKVYGGALTTFLILFGTGLSPLPTSTPESFSTRIVFVSLAVAYAVLATALLWLREPVQRSLSSEG